MQRPTRHDCRWSRLRFIDLLIALIFSLLLWRPTNAAAGQTAADYYVHSLPGAPAGPLLKMHAGHIEVDAETHGNLFFWLFHNRHLADRSRTVIWLNGGPGCSSMDGALMEVGPYRVRSGGHLEYSNGSWDEFANLLFVDQPVGTGFSYVDTNAYLHDLDQMADQMVKFLENFFDIFPDLSHDDIYIAGESYAGQHIPYVASAIIDRHKKRQVDIRQQSSSRQAWSLKGLLIGNGWTSPRDQYPSYLKYAYNASMITPGTSEARQIEAQQNLCETQLSNGGADHVDTEACEAILQEILKVTRDESKPKAQQCYNMYDVRLRDEYSSCGMNWPPDLRDVTPYLRRADVKTALHVDEAKQTGWTECSGAVSGAFKARNSAPAVTLLPDILTSVPILLFSGEKDLICNHLGTEALIRNLAFNGGTGLETSPGVWAPRRQWIFEQEPAGFYQQARNLTYVVFYNASHMVPFDYPRRTRDMLDRFMGVDIGSTGGEPKQSLIDGEQAGPETSVGGHPNSTAAAEAEKGKVAQAETRAYYRSGEVALVLVVIAAAAWGWWVWRERRRRRLAGYKGVGGGEDDDDADGPSAGQVLEGMRDAAIGGYKSLRKGSISSLTPTSAGGAGSGWGGRSGGARGVAAGNAGFAWRKSSGRRDLEAADFDEAELDNMTPAGEKRYDLADDEGDGDGDSEEGQGSSSQDSRKCANGVKGGGENGKLL